MATSSIFATVVISDEESAQTIVKAFEDFEANGSPRKISSEDTVMKPDEIKAFFDREVHDQ